MYNAKLDIKENIIQSELKDEAYKAIATFAPNKNVYRHIPFQTDGLVPGERRVLYAMFDIVKAMPDKNFKKLATIIGATMNLHPHGDGNIYNTIVKLAQEWKNANIFIEGDGSFGNEVGDPAAAFRYLEAKLSKFAYKCYFEDFSKDIVPMRAGFIDGIFEPEYLPARYPVVLTKSCKAIGYGMFSQFPNFNFKELVEFTLKLMDDPSYDRIMYPDIPNHCEIIDDGQFDEIRRTGVGSFRMKSKVNIDREKNAIEVISVPLGANLQQIADKILALAKEGHLPGFADIHNENDKRGKKKKKKKKGEKAKLSITVIFKPGTDLDKSLEIMYKKTNMLATSAFKLDLVDDYRVKSYTVRTVLLEWIEFRRDIKRRQINKEIVRLMERIHELEILIFVTKGKNGEKTIKLSSNSANDAAFRDSLIREYGITTLQAKSICNMKTTAFNKAAHESYIKEKDEKQEAVNKLLDISRSSKKIDEIIKNELKEGIELFSTPRRSEVVEFGEKSYVPDTDHRIVITKENRIKKLSSKEKGVGILENGDKGKNLFTVNNRSSIMVFDRKGNMTEICVNDITSTPVDSTGVDLANMINIAGSVVASFPKPEETIDGEDTFLILTTKKGLSKKLSYKNFKKTRGTVSAIKLADDDELVSVDVLYGKKDIIVYTKDGGGVRISTEDIRECGRAAYGLSVIDLADEDSVIGTTIINKSHKYILIVTNKGKMKKCTLSTFTTMKRKSPTLQLSRLDKSEYIVSVNSVKDSNKFMVYTQFVEEEFKVKDIPELTRQHPCKKILGVKNGDKVIDVEIQ